MNNVVEYFKYGIMSHVYIYIFNVEMQLIYNGMSVSGVQQSELEIYK